MALLETTFLIDLLRGNSEVKKLQEDLEKSETRLIVAVPSVMELWSGALISKRPEQEKAKIAELLESLDVADLETESAKEAGVIERELEAKGLSMSTVDFMIAGIARKIGEKIVTRDELFTKVSGLQVLKY